MDSWNSSRRLFGFKRIRAWFRCHLKEVEVVYLDGFVDFFGGVGGYFTDFLELKSRLPHVKGVASPQTHNAALRTGPYRFLTLEMPAGNSRCVVCACLHIELAKAAKTKDTSALPALHVRPDNKRAPLGGCLFRPRKASWRIDLPGGPSSKRHWFVDCRLVNTSTEM